MLLRPDEVLHLLKQKYTFKLSHDSKSDTENVVENGETIESPIIINLQSEIKTEDKEDPDNDEMEEPEESDENEDSNTGKSQGSLFQE